jgi:methylthioribose-1-phosphate isomerase
MGRGLVDCIIVGADRIAANGDGTKIGTYGLAVLAHAHGIPMYVAAPTSTIDMRIADGSMIPLRSVHQTKSPWWQACVLPPRCHSRTSSI